MKQINIRIREDEQEKILSSLRVLLCDNSIKTISKGISEMLNRLVINSTDKDDLANDDSFHVFNREIKSRLSLQHYEILKKSSESHRWSLSKEIRFRLNHTLNDDFDVFDNELREFHISRNAIDKVGRNIRFIIAHNQNMILDKNEFSNDIREVISLTMGLRDKFDHYIKLCGNRKVSNKFRSYDAAEN